MSTSKSDTTMRSISRTASSIVPLAIGRLAQTFRMLLEKDTGKARTDFKDDPNLKELTKLLAELGYEWELETTNAFEKLLRCSSEKAGLVVPSRSSVVRRARAPHIFVRDIRA